MSKYAGIVKGLTKLVKKLDDYKAECAAEIASRHENIQLIKTEVVELTAEQTKATNCADKLREIVG